MASVRFETVRKTFEGGVRAVDGFDLHVDDGEFVVLVGPSGCGKSTTLRMLAGLEAPTSGSIHIGARDVTDWSPGARNVAMVFQNYALYPHLSVQENLAFGLRVRRTPRAEIRRRVHAVAELLDVADLLRRKPGELSGGQRQRVALGRAMVREPDVFLFDEPLSNLDARLRMHMRAELGRLRNRLATTTLYVTHDQTEAMTLGDRVVVMDNGRIQQVDAPMDIYHRPANRFVARFMGSPPMNLLDAPLDGGHARTVLGDVAVPERLAARTRLQMGVRPEHVAVVDDGTRAAAVLQVDVVEPVGAQVVVYGRVQETPVTVQLVAGRVPAPGDRLDVRVDPSRVHWFDPSDGTAV